jgi:hypothetical protein
MQQTGNGGNNIIKYNNILTTKINKFRAPINNTNNSNLKNPKQISINISSSQSPENKSVIYHYETVNNDNLNEFKLELVSTSNNNNKKIVYDNNSKLNMQKNIIEFPQTRKEVSSKKINFNEILKVSPKQDSERPVLLMDFLKERYGEEKLSCLISLIEKSNNPIEALNDINSIKGIVGEDYKVAQNFLSILINSSGSR